MNRTEALDVDAVGVRSGYRVAWGMENSMAHQEGCTTCALLQGKNTRNRRRYWWSSCTIRIARRRQGRPGAHRGSRGTRSASVGSGSSASTPPFAPRPPDLAGFMAGLKLAGIELDLEGSPISAMNESEIFGGIIRSGAGGAPRGLSVEHMTSRAPGTSPCARASFSNTCRDPCGAGVKQGRSPHF